MEKKIAAAWPGWEVVKLIGRGSFGAVYEIQRDIFGDVDKAALKVITIPQNPSDVDELLGEGYDQPTITARFESYLKDIIHEYALMAKLKGHSHVVYCDDVRYIQHDDGIGWDIYIKMELLTPLLRVSPAEVDEQTVLTLGQHICAALEACRSLDIVHRDIKPQNIFVGPDGSFKLGDFGVAKVSEKTTGGTKIGTYKYMAPEVYHSKPYGAAADIYSLGLVLYWLLNERRHPFLPLPPEAPTSSLEEQARQRRLMGEALPAPKHGSEALKAIVLKACSYDPADRYADAAEMRKALERVSDNPVNGGTATRSLQQPAATPTPDRLQKAKPMPFKPEEHTVGVYEIYPADTEETATVGIISPVQPAAPGKPAIQTPDPQMGRSINFVRPGCR